MSYWRTNYDWRKIEARLNALPQFVTTIDGVEIHFIHVRSNHPNALPIIVTHGWPGSVIEQLKIVGPLTNPTAHNGRAEDAFDVVIPSMPGFGFSGKPNDTGAIRPHCARLMELMKRLGTAATSPGWRLGLSRLQRDGAPGAGRIARHSHQLAGDNTARNWSGACCRRARAGGIVRK